VATTGFAPGEREPFEDLRRSGKENAYLLRCHFVVAKTDRFTKTGSGQTQGKFKKGAAFSKNRCCSRHCLPDWVRSAPFYCGAIFFFV
jgi:hypothetical protein